MLTETENLPNRLLPPDVFRAITVAGMLLVNNPGTGAAIFDNVFCLAQRRLTLL